MTNRPIHDENDSKEQPHLEPEADEDADAVGVVPHAINGPRKEPKAPGEDNEQGVPHDVELPLSKECGSPGSPSWTTKWGTYGQLITAGVAIVGTVWSNCRSDSALIEARSNRLADMAAAEAQRRVDDEAAVARAQEDKRRFDATLATSSRALEEAIERGRLEQRAWVTVVDFTAGQSSGVIRFANNGRTPAVNVRVERATVRQGNAPPRVVKVESLVGVLGPNGTGDATLALFESGAFDPAIFDSAIFDTGRVQLAGVIAYEDIFRRVHHTRFCYWMKSLTEWEACTSGNEAG